MNHCASDGPVRLVVMGVAGAGKTVVAREVAARCGLRFVDGDDHHSPANVAKMAQGEALTEEDRGPWLRRLSAELAAGDGIVLACSALRRSHRDALRAAGDVRFVHLDVPRATARRRAGARRGHFMGPDMVAGQFATLEAAQPDESDVIVVDARAPLGAVVDRVLASPWMRTVF